MTLFQIQGRNGGVVNNSGRLVGHDKTVRIVLYAAKDHMVQVRLGEAKSKFGIFIVLCDLLVSFSHI
jgi:hypothetical protein